MAFDTKLLSFPGETRICAQMADQLFVIFGERNLERVPCASMNLDPKRWEESPSLGSSTMAEIRYPISSEISIRLEKLLLLILIHS